MASPTPTSLPPPPRQPQPQQQRHQHPHPPTLYFAYGSNLSPTQMAARCPTSPYLAPARLHNWRWIINTRGYANIVPAAGEVVYGLVYELSAADEVALDGEEGVPGVYGKVGVAVEVLVDGVMEGVGDGVVGEEGAVVQRRRWMVYVDERRVGEGVPRREYVGRMNRGIVEAGGRGLPGGYVRGVLRAYIPEEGGGEGEGWGVCEGEAEGERVLRVVN